MHLIGLKSKLQLMQTKNETEQAYEQNCTKTHKGPISRHPAAKLAILQGSGAVPRSSEPLIFHQTNIVEPPCKKVSNYA